jgi:iron-sulfur cluster repair protein YtfE (RIC family)
MQIMETRLAKGGQSPYTLGREIDMDTISAYLEKDHSRCDGFYLRSLACVATRDWQQAAELLDQFAQELQRHFTMEEEVVFAAFEAATGATSGPTESLRREHRQLSGILERLADAVAQRHVSDVADHADTFRIMLWHHALKEEGILHPLADRVLHGQHVELIGAMKAIASVDGLPDRSGGADQGAGG